MVIRLLVFFQEAAPFTDALATRLEAEQDVEVVTHDVRAAIEQAWTNLRNHGRSRRSWCDHEFIGVNSRLDGLQAMVLNAKLPRLNAWTEARRSIPVPCHQQAPYGRFATRSLPVAEESASDILSLPMFPHMSDDMVARVCDAVSEALGPGEPWLCGPRLTVTETPHSCCGHHDPDPQRLQS